MNLHDGGFNPGKGARARPFRGQLMGPPAQPTPRTRTRSSAPSSKTSELPWGRNHESLVFNTSSNQKSTSSKSTGYDNEDQIIVAITEGRGQASCEVGVAAVNVSKPVMTLCQTSDTQSYTNTLTKLNLLNPSVVVYPATFGTQSRIILGISSHFPNIKLVPMPRKAFNKENGVDTLCKICIPKSFAQTVMIKNRYYALAAASGLLTYLQDRLFIYYATNSIDVQYQACEGYAVVDLVTADRLELVRCNRPAQANKFSTLFGVMNRCLTRVGTRHLRSIVLQPLYSGQKLKERQDCMEELIGNREMMFSIQAILPKLSKVDQLLSLSTLVPLDAQSCTNKQLNYLLLLNSILDTIDPLKEALKNGSQPFFLQFKDLLENEEFDIIRNFIRQTIHGSAHYANGQQGEQQRIWAIKPDVNGLLDCLRKLYSERVDEMKRYVEKLGHKYDLSFKLANNNKKGYHISMALKRGVHRKKKSDLPMEFIQVQELPNSFTMKTVEMVNLSTRLDDMLLDLLYLSSLTIHGVIVQVRTYMPLFFQLVENVSYLDVLQSLAEASASNQWVRPKFDDYTEVVDGRHPILNCLRKTSPVPNSVTACNHYNVHIITGPNGAGKSIFIRQVMLLQIMAQTGCFVPATSATFRLADRMFARVGKEDDMENNASTFMLELTEINYFLTTATRNSLVIIDELCRATSPEEGTAIAMYICHVLAKMQSFCFITTHYLLLTKVADVFFNIKLWQMKTIPSGDLKDPKSLKLDFRFSLIPGITSLRGYGVYMARGIWLDEVMEIVDDLQGQYTPKSHEWKSSGAISSHVRLRYDLDCKIDKLKRQNKFTISNLNALLSEYKSKISELGQEGMRHVVDRRAEGNDYTDTSAGLDHSIFLNASDTPYAAASPKNLSQLYLENFEQDRRDIQAEHPIISRTSYPEQSTSTEGPSFTIVEEIYPLSAQKQHPIFGASEQSYYSATSEPCSIFQPEIDIHSGNTSECRMVAENPDQAFRNRNDESFEQASLLSSQALSDKLQVLRQEQGLGTKASSSFAPSPNSQSSYLEFFVPGKTSTPLTPVPSIGSARNIAQVSQINTSKFSFTINHENAGDIDLASVVEDLEAFAEEIEKEETMADEDSGDQGRNYTEKNNVDRSIIKSESGLYPKVTILRGSSWISSEEDISSSAYDPGIVVRPTVRGIEGNILENQAVKNEDVENIIVEDNTNNTPASSEKNMADQDEGEQSRNYAEENKRFSPAGRSVKCQSGFYPKITIIRGPSWSSSEGDSNSSAFDPGLVARPTVRIPKYIQASVPENEATKIDGVKEDTLYDTAASSTSEFSYSPLVTESCSEIKAEGEVIGNTKESVAIENASISETPGIKSSLYWKTMLIDSKRPVDPTSKCCARAISPDDPYETADSMKSEPIYSPSVTKTGSQVQIFMEQEDAPPKSSLEKNSTRNIQDTLFDESTEKVLSGQSSVAKPPLKDEKNIINTSWNNSCSPIDRGTKLQDVNPQIVIISDILLKSSDAIKNTLITNLEPAEDKSYKKDETFDQKVTKAVHPPSVLPQTCSKEKIKRCPFSEFIDEFPVQSTAQLQANYTTSSKNSCATSKVSAKVRQKNPPSQTQFLTYEDKGKTCPILEVNTRISPKKQSPPRSFLKYEEDDDLKVTGRTSEKSNKKGTETTSTSRSSKRKTDDTMGISEISRLRNLDDDTSSSSGCKSRKGTANNEVFMTSVSEASKKRNLDNNGSSPAISSDTKENDVTSKSSSAKESTESDSKGYKRKAIKKFSAPWKKPKTEQQSSKSSSSSVSFLKNVSSMFLGIGTKRHDPIYPFKNLTQKAIKQDFFEQDKKFFEFMKTPKADVDMTKMWEKRWSRPARPTPQQVQEIKCLATIRKTTDGVKVIHTEDEENSIRKPTTTSFKSLNSGVSMNMNIFSDKNADVFEEFIKSDLKDYRSFNFDFGYGKRMNTSGNLFQFKQASSVCSEYTQNSQTWTLVRKNSDEYTLRDFNQHTQRSTANQEHTTTLLRTTDTSRTPEGFYKRNKEDIVGLLKKYR